MPKISLIIPIYNALDDVKLCLESLSNNFNFCLGEIIIINDCSNKETTKFLKIFGLNNPKFKILENEENLGFVKTCNRGMKLAQGDIVVLLNSDTKIPQEFCERIIKCFSFDKKIGVASPIGSYTAQYFIPLPDNFTIEDMNIYLRKKHKCKYPLILAAEGFCFCMRKQVIEQQGYLDEIFGKGYHEETDFSLRALTNGWNNVLIDDLYVYHKRQASFGAEMREKLIKQNNPIYHKRWDNFKKAYKKSHKLKNPINSIRQQLFPDTMPDACKRSSIEYLFSIKNTNNKKHKIITILGLKIKIKNKARNTKVVYTCISGDYDNLIIHKYINKKWDYICFTSSPKLLEHKQIGPWKIQELQYTELDNTRNARWHKIMPHKILNEYNESIWVDGNIDILTSKLFKTIKKKNSDFLIPIHDQRSCIYDECNAALKYNKITPEEAEITYKFLKTNKMPRYYGLHESNILYRKHNNENIKQLMEDWFYCIKNISKRDQLSLSYILWKNNIPVIDIAIENARIDFINYKIYKHGEKVTNLPKFTIFNITTASIHTIITFLGIKFKFTNNKLIGYNQYLELKHEINLLTFKCKKYDYIIKNINLLSNLNKDSLNIQLNEEINL